MATDVEVAVAAVVEVSPEPVVLVVVASGSVTGVTPEGLSGRGGGDSLSGIVVNDSTSSEMAESPVVVDGVSADVPMFAESTSGSISASPLITQPTPENTRPTSTTANNATAPPEMRRPTTTLSRQENPGSGGGGVAASRRARSLANSSGLEFRPARWGNR